MATRSTVRRLLVAVPAAALVVGAVSACHPPRENPADSDAGYTLPSYSEPPKPAGHVGKGAEKGSEGKASEGKGAEKSEEKGHEEKPGEGQTSAVTSTQAPMPGQTTAPQQSGAQHTGMTQPPA